MERLIVELHLEGCTQDQITNRLHIGKHRVNNTLKFFKNSGNIPSARKRGAPTKLTPVVQNFIEIRTLLDAKSSNKEIQKDIENNFQISISSTSVSKARKAKNFRYSPPKIEQQLTQNINMTESLFVKKCYKMFNFFRILHSVMNRS